MNSKRQPTSVALLLKQSGLQYDLPLFTKLDSLLQGFLKQHNIKGCRVGNLQNGSLVIEIPDANWMMRLQFMRNELLSELRKASPGLLKINIKVNPRLSAQLPKLKKAKTTHKIRATKMSEEVADSFLALADDADPDLKKALQSLASFSQKNSTK